MINDKLIDVFLQCAEQKDLIKGIKEIFNHFKLEDEYQYEELVNNVINVIGGDKLTTIDDIDIELIKANIDHIAYRSEEVNKDSIKISDINVINNTVKIAYKRETDKYNTYNRIKYIDYLKKVKEN